MAIILNWDSGPLPETAGGVFTLGHFSDIWPIDWINVDHTGNGPARATLDLGNDYSQVSVRAYVRTPPRWPTNTNQFMQVTPAGNPNSIGLAFAGDANGGQLRVMHDTGSTASVLAMSPIKALNVGRWYRVMLRVDFINQRTYAAIYHLHTNTPLWESGNTAISLPPSMTAARLHVGAVQGSLLMPHIRFAHIRVNDTYQNIARDSGDTYPWDPPAGDYSQIRLVSGPPNGDFEDGDTGWVTNANMHTVDSGTAHSGAKVMELDVDSSDRWPVQTPARTATPGEKVRVGAWFRRASGTSAIPAGVIMSTWDASSVRTNVVTPSAQRISLTSGTWQHVETEFTIPAGAVEVAFGPWAGPTPGAVAHADSIAVLSTPSAMQLWDYGGRLVNAVAVTSVSGPFVVNGGFEEGGTGWATDPAIVPTNSPTARTGSMVLRLDVAAGRRVPYCVPVDFSPGEKVMAVAYFRRQSGSSPVQCRMQARYRDSGNSVITVDQSPTVDVTSGDWVRVSHEFTAPSGTASLEIAPTAEQASGCVVDVDDVTGAVLH